MIFRTLASTFIIGLPLFILDLSPSFSEGLKIGFVSTDRVFKESAPAIESQKNLQKEFAAREEEIRKTADTRKECLIIVSRFLKIILLIIGVGKV